MLPLKAVVPVVFWLSLLALTSGDNPLEIKTKSGKVKGHTESTIIGKDVDAFLGIPYGAANTGSNRFGPPKAAEPWDGVLDATKLPNPCYQILSPAFKTSEFQVFMSQLKETENCLKLNIWIPKPRPKKSAVMVWIHGGGFATGSSDLAIYSGSIMAAQENLIVVSMNYRLSGFGFLYLGHPKAPGNVGLMDQALALQWVKKNIKSFGGDPEKVTIFGHSAGGGSVGLQLLAPSSFDLFKNAILQSGAGDCFWATYSPEEAIEQSLTVAEKVGCPTDLDHREQIIKCLQDVDAEKLANTIISMDGAARMTFRPVVDGTFLPQPPTDLLTEGKFCGEKSVMIGHTKEDGPLLVPFTNVLSEINEDTTLTEEQIRKVMSESYCLNSVGGQKLNLVKYIYTDWDSYPHDRIAARTKVIEYVTDRWFACCALNTANKMSEKGNKVFFFRFDHIPKKSAIPLKLPSWFGSIHGDELPFVLGQQLQSKDEEAKFSMQIMRYWANFAKTSDPNDEFLPTWPSYDSKEKLMLLLNGSGMTVAKNGRNKECAFWQYVFPNVGDKSKDEL